MKKLSRRTKRNIWRAIILVILLSMAMFLSGQEPLQTKPIYRDYGTWSIQVEGNTVGVRAYITKEKIYTEAKKQEYTKEAQRYRYELYLESKSVYRGERTSTWLYGARVYINGREVTYQNYPNGITLSAGTEPTLIYWYEVSMADLEMAITWENAIYENRNF